MTATACFWVATGALILAFVAALGSQVIYEVAWHELKMLCRRRKQMDLFDAIHENHDEVALRLEVARLLAYAAMFISLTVWLLHLQGDWPATRWDWFLLLSVMTIVLLGVLIWIPAAIARIWAEVILIYTWSLLQMMSLCVFPVAHVTHGLVVVLRRMAGTIDAPTDEEAFEEEVMTIVTEGLHDGHLEADARQMIEGVMDLDDNNAADIMTPRSDVDAVEAHLNVAEAAAFVNKCGRTRVPVFEKEFDRVVGVLYAKDLLRELSHSATDQSDAEKTVRDLMRDHWSVPQTRPLDDLLNDFLRSRTHLAIVVDEFQSVAGIVTIEDVLEEIVGEIVDETDDEEIGEIRPVDEFTAKVNGRTHLADVNEQLGLGLPEPEDFDTIGGLVISHLGRIPETGETIKLDSVRITVLAASKRRVEEVLVASSAGIATHVSSSPSLPLDSNRSVTRQGGPSDDPA